MTKQCPCNDELDYENCCKPFHQGKLAPSAEKLMRSRYSAYVLKLEDYLIKTWHPSKKPKKLDLQNDQTKWLGLKIISTKKGLENDFEGEVEFEAKFEIDGKTHLMIEKSKFVKRSNAWIYKEGKVINS